MKRILILAVATAFALTGCQSSLEAQPSSDKYILAPKASEAAKEKPGTKTAIFAGGCFWCVEGVFSHTKGVSSAVSGYHGGASSTATYAQSNTGITGHAEAVKITYDPAIIRYDELLQIFFTVVADPTLKDRQGPDIGPQYRAALVPLSPTQEKVAVAYLEQMEKSGKWTAPIVTPVEAHMKFYPAEDYHQDFTHLNPYHPYVVRFSNPKVEGLEEIFPQFFREEFLSDHNS